MGASGARVLGVSHIRGIAPIAPAHLSHQRTSCTYSTSRTFSHSFMRSEHALDASIWHKPHQRHDDVQSLGHPLCPEGQGNGCGVDDWRQLALPIATDSLLQK